MNKEQLHKRIQELQQYRANALQQVQMAAGALEDCYFWLKELEASELESKGVPKDAKLVAEVG